MLCRYLLVCVNWSFTFWNFLELKKKKLLIHDCWFFKLIVIGVQLLYSDVFITIVQQSESIICLHITPLFRISFPFRLPQSTEEIPLCYTVGSHGLSILHIIPIVIHGCLNPCMWNPQQRSDCTVFSRDCPCLLSQITNRKFISSWSWLTKS